MLLEMKNNNCCCSKSKDSDVSINNTEQTIPKIETMADFNDMEENIADKEERKKLV